MLHCSRDYITFLQVPNVNKNGISVLAQVFSVVLQIGCQATKVNHKCFNMLRHIYDNFLWHHGQYFLSFSLNFILSYLTSIKHWKETWGTNCRSGCMPTKEEGNRIKTTISHLLRDILILFHATSSGTMGSYHHMSSVIRGGGIWTVALRVGYSRRMLSEMILVSLRHKKAVPQPNGFVTAGVVAGECEVIQELVAAVNSVVSSQRSRTTLHRSWFASKTSVGSSARCSRCATVPAR